MTEAARQPLDPDQVQAIADQIFEGAANRRFADVEGETIVDFSKKRKRVRFKVDDDVFEAFPSLPVESAFKLMEYSERWEQATTAEHATTALKELFSLCLRPPSLDRFLPRLANPDDPIDPEQLPQILVYLMEQYGLRPTLSSSGSSGTPGPPDDGTTSTGGRPSTTSTSSPSPSTGS